VQAALRALSHNAGSLSGALNIVPIMPWARTGHTYIAYALGLLLVIQFFLAGLGTVGGESIEPHQMVGSLMQLLSLVLLVLAVLARYRGPLLGMTIFLFVAMVLQSVWINIDDPLWIHSIHVLMALVIAMTIREVVDVSRAERTATPSTPRA
jgi:hypothetical protein